MKNYFSFYSLEPAFIIDEQDLRQKYLKMSREFHPDYFSLESDERQKEVLELSTYNNQAYKTLVDFEKRFAYILEMHGLLDESKNKKALPQSFLMEMMEVNEALMELELDFKISAFEMLEKSIGDFKSMLIEDITPYMYAYNKDNTDDVLLNELLIFYLKRRYLKRLEDNLQRINSTNS